MSHNNNLQSNEQIITAVIEFTREFTTINMFFVTESQHSFSSRLIIMRNGSTTTLFNRVYLILLDVMKQSVYMLTGTLVNTVQAAELFDINPGLK